MQPATDLVELEAREVYAWRVAREFERRAAIAALARLPNPRGVGHRLTQRRHDMKAWRTWHYAVMVWRERRRDRLAFVRRTLRSVS